MSRENQNTTSGNKRKNQGNARKSPGRSAAGNRSGIQQRSRKNTKRKRRKQAPDYRLIALIGVALMFIITGVLWVSKNKKTDSSPEVAVTTRNNRSRIGKNSFRRRGAHQRDVLCRGERGFDEALRMEYEDCL